MPDDQHEVSERSAGPAPPETEGVTVVELGPIALWVCPNGQGCVHGIEAHRYDEQRGIWRCTAPSCRENPDNYPGISADSWFDPLLVDETSAEIRRRLGLRWWQRIPRSERG